MLFGRTGNRNLDHPDSLPILEAAAALRAPLYIHPQTPQPGVRAAYYQGLGDEIDHTLATGGIGWHYESGIQAIRLILSGIFDKLPDLRIILGLERSGAVLLGPCPALLRLGVAEGRAALPRSRGGGARLPSPDRHLPHHAHGRGTA